MKEQVRSRREGSKVCNRLEKQLLKNTPHNAYTHTHTHTQVWLPAPDDPLQRGVSMETKCLQVYNNNNSQGLLRRAISLSSPLPPRLLVESMDELLICCDNSDVLDSKIPLEQGWLSGGVSPPTAM